MIINNRKIFSEDGTDITPNIEFQYNEKNYEDTEDNSYKFTEKDFNMCNLFFQSLHVHKSVENGDFQNPFWNFVIPDTETEKHKIIKVPHEKAFSPLKIMRAFQGVGFPGFPKIFTKKNKGFLWENFMDFIIERFEDAAIIEEDPLDSISEAFICKLCEVAQRDEEIFYNGNVKECGAVFEREGILCFNVKTNLVNELISENRLPIITNKLSTNLNKKKFKLYRTWQRNGVGPRIWSFPVEKLEPYGFTVNMTKKANYGTNIITSMDDIFNHQPQPENMEFIDSRTGIKRGDI
jgi:hypothetical protein